MSKRNKRKTSPRVLLNPNDSAPWSKDDRRWFAANPRRSFRLRRLYPGEFGGWPVVETYVIVCQRAPGWRERRPVDDNVGGELLDSMGDSQELELQVLWRHIVAGGGFLPQESLSAAAWAMRHTGGTGVAQ